MEQETTKINKTFQPMLDYLAERRRFHTLTTEQKADEVLNAHAVLYYRVAGRHLYKDSRKRYAVDAQVKATLKPELIDFFSRPAHKYRCSPDLMIFRKYLDDDDFRRIDIVGERAFTALAKTVHQDIKMAERERDYYENTCQVCKENDCVCAEVGEHDLL